MTTQDTWIFLLRQKCDVCVSLQFFMNFTRNQFGKTAKIVRTDNGTEFINSLCEQLFKQLGIIHQTTCVYTPQQNGVAERKHRHILENIELLGCRLIYL